MSPLQDPSLPGIGTALKDARRRLGMDVKEAEERTKIRAKYLRALEAEDWEVLPAPAYVRGFLRTYGHLLGLDGEMLADQFRRRYEVPVAAVSAAAEPLLQERRRANGSRPPSRGPLIGAIAGGIVVLLVILWALGSGGDDPKPTVASGAGAKSEKGNASAPGQLKSEKGPSEQVPISVKIEPIDAIQVCLVGGTDEALVDAQMLAAGATQGFSDHKNYRLDLEGAGALKLTAGGESQRLVSNGKASFEADSNGIHEINYAGPECP